jgi:hypothetical protein
MPETPIAARFTTAPLRNRLRVRLHATTAEAWALIGDLARFPEYSSGLERVDAEYGADGGCTGYTCHFKPVAADEAGIVSREVIRWWDPPRGYASSSEGGDEFALTNDLNLVVLEPAEHGTTVTIDEYFDHLDVPMMQAHFDEALRDIGDNLVERFGGTLLERYVEPSARRPVHGERPLQ